MIFIHNISFEINPQEEQIASKAAHHKNCNFILSGPAVSFRFSKNETLANTAAGLE
jgi:hypothetical protein